MFKNIPTKPIIGILALGVFLGFAVVGGFDTFVGYTSSNRFCGATCHEMRAVAEEYRQSVFHKNSRGLRVGCADCHVPKPLFAKLWRKAKASREVYHTVMGTIDTPEKFEAKRIVLARSEWRRLQEADSRECRDCHVYDAMITDAQPGDARFWHPVAMDEGYTCIDCHKGIAHRLPDLKGEIQKAAERFTAVLTDDALTVDDPYIARATALYFGPSMEDAILADLEPGTPVAILERNDDRLRIRVQGRQYQGNHRALYSASDKMVALARMREGASLTIGEQTTLDDTTGLDWRPGEMEGWVSRKDLVSEISSLWDYGKTLYQNECMRCHVVFSPTDFWATEWKNNLRNMRRKTDLAPEEMNIMLRYLQHHAKPQGTI
uniref:Cytochrome c-type protein n=1 Tax=Candidatus Kentrum sp. LPFa TaxID=2126335 RepID=A0A450WCE1_9GAMM|nr:MAG: trimethylamine-N-oxide reductase (cytochrome c), cytochrome c-type subunit TorC [Candidatus Kentron sp. LPFa]